MRNNKVLASRIEFIVFVEKKDSHKKLVVLLTAAAIFEAVSHLQSSQVVSLTAK